MEGSEWKLVACYNTLHKGSMTKSDILKTLCPLGVSRMFVYRCIKLIWKLETSRTVNGPYDKGSLERHQVHQKEICSRNSMKTVQNNNWLQLLKIVGYKIKDARERSSLSSWEVLINKITYGRLFKKTSGTSEERHSGRNATHRPK